MSEPMIRTTEPAVAAGVFANGLAKAPVGFERLPTQDELPYSDGEPMESERHFFEIMMLLQPLRHHWAGRDDFYAGGNMFVYFSPEQVKHNDFRGPDFFVVMGANGNHERKSWVMWDEGGQLPNLVIEFLSESTAAFDRKGKKLIYQNQWRTQEYFYFDPFTDEFEGFTLGPQGYEPMLRDEQGRFISRVTGLALRRWVGPFSGVTAPWLRWETLDGELLPTPEEIAKEERLHAEQEHKRATTERKRANAAEALVEHERARAEQERVRAEHERARAEQERARAEQERAEKERFAAKLRELGIDSDTIK
jgi:Uma2 family endonuclease